MYETTVTLVGNVLTRPDSRRLVESQALVTHFKVASTSRRFDRSNDRWVDGDSLRVRVNCWRQLAENVARSVNVGDPVIITGRLFSRDWEGEDHVKRVSYELEAFSVGHDLARGRARFSRVKANTRTSAVDDELAERRIAGELTVPAAELNGLPRRRSYDDELGGYVTLVEEYAGDRDPFADVDADADAVLAELAAVADEFDTASAEPGGAAGDDEDGGAAARAASVEPDVEEESDDPSGGPEAPEDEEPVTGRRKRSRRVPVPA